MYEFIKSISVVVMAAILVFWAMIALGRSEWTINKYLYRGIMLTLFGAFIVYVYCFTPTPITRWDLLEHYKTLNLIKENGWTYLWTDGLYKSRYITSLYFYFISHMPNYRLLPVIPLIIDFSIFLYIFQDSMKTSEEYEAYPIGDAAFITLAWITTFGMKLAVSGIRCVCAVSICALAIYWEAIQKKHRGASYVLYIIAYGIHDFAMVIILIRMMMIVKNKAKLAVVVFLVMVGISVALPVLYAVAPSSGLRRIYRYWTERSMLSFMTARGRSTSELSVVLSMIVVMVYHAYINFKVYRKMHTYPTRMNGYPGQNPVLTEKRKHDLAVIEFTSTLAVAGIAACYVYVFTERLLYLIAYSLVLSIPYYRKLELNHFAMDIMMLVLMLWLWFFNDIYIFLVNETGVFFLAR